MQVSTALAALIVVIVVSAGATMIYAPQAAAPGGKTTTSSSTAGLASAKPVFGNFSGSFFQAPQHDLFRSQDLWWVFYSNGTDIVYRTSADGVAWAQPVVVRAPGEGFAAWVRGDTVYYAASERPANTSLSYFFYRYGALNPNGSIVWGTAEQHVQTKYPLSGYSDAIAVDESGNVWVAGSVANSTVALEVYRYSATGSQWQLAKVVDGGLESSISTLVPLRSGVALVYGGFPDTCCSESPLYVTTSSDGATWSAVVSPPSRDYYMSFASAVSLGDTLYVAAPSLSNGLQFWTYTYGSNSTSPESNLAAIPVADSLSESDGALVATYAFNGSVYERASADLGRTWGSPALISTNEFYATLMTSTFSGDFGLLWNGAIWNGSEQIGHYVKFYSAPPASLLEKTSTTTSSLTTSTSTATQEYATVTGDVSVGPAHPICQGGQYCNVNMTGYAIGFTEQGGTSEAYNTLTYNGSFSVELAPGTYLVNLYYCNGTAFPADCVPSCPWLGCSSFYVNNKELVSFPFPITVANGQTTVLDISISTGIA